MNFFLSKNRVKSFAVLLLVGMNFMTNAQISVSLTEVDAVSKPGQKCYQVVLTNLSKKDLTLAGQNYRLYYDSETAKLSEGSLKTMLPSQYTSMKLVEHHFDVDASGFGTLPYESHLAFINIATDLNLSAAKGIFMPYGKSIATVSMCFDVADAKTPVFTWAQDHLTQTYATAFVEIATLEGEQLKKATITDYKIEQNRVSSTQQANVFDLKYFPNPFTDKLNITFNESLTSDATCTIRDVFGSEISKNKIAKGSIDYTLEGQHLPNGALLIEIKTAEGQISVMKAIKIE
jgi:Secretion system C-terminal sorting domain